MNDGKIIIWKMKKERNLMGTDVYLLFDGQKENQTTGYIRASIGMVNENFILRQIFPPECWEDTEENNFKYTFDLIPKLMRLREQYLDAVRNSYKLGSMSESGVDHGHGIESFLKSLHPEGTFVMPCINELGQAKLWFAQIFAHVNIGIIKEMNGLNPRVYISW